VALEGRGKRETHSKGMKGRGQLFSRTKKKPFSSDEKGDHPTPPGDMSRGKLDALFPEKPPS